MRASWPKCGRRSSARSVTPAEAGMTSGWAPASIVRPERRRRAVRTCFDFAQHERRGAGRAINSPPARSPDMHALVGREVELVARLDVERRIPGVDVADDAVDAILGRAVRIDQQRLALGALALLGAPHLRE